MCKVYNTVGALTTIKQRLAKNKITGFDSPQELISFQNNYNTAREHIVSNQRLLLTEERNSLNSRILELENEIASDKKEIQHRLQSEIDGLRKQYDALGEAKKSVVQEFTYSFKALYILIKRKYIEFTSDRIVNTSVRPKVEMLKAKRERYDYLVSNFEEAVTLKGGVELNELDHKKRVIDELNSFIYGAIGEQMVVEELKQLSDDYILINDFAYSFQRPVFDYQTKRNIHYVQMDHLLICSAGVFLIETKNWSKESLKNLDLRSPLEQIKRANSALYHLLHRNSNSLLAKHHWGERKITLLNLIVMIHNRPQEKFKFVTIRTLSELVTHIRHQESDLSNTEVRAIADHLLNINNGGF